MGFDMRPKPISPRDTILHHLGLAGLLLLLVSVPAIEVCRTWAGARAEKRLWTIAGPACPIVDRPEPSVVGHKPPRTFMYNQIAFTLHLGDASCAAFREDGVLAKHNYSVCQFSGPGAVTVETAGRRTTFQTGAGRRATVTVRGGAATCVAAGWFARRPRGYRTVVG